MLRSAQTRGTGTRTVAPNCGATAPTSTAIAPRGTYTRTGAPNRGATAPLRGYTPTIGAFAPPPTRGAAT